MPHTLALPTCFYFMNINILRFSTVCCHNTNTTTYSAPRYCVTIKQDNIFIFLFVAFGCVLEKCMHIRMKYLENEIERPRPSKVPLNIPIWYRKVPNNNTFIRMTSHNRGWQAVATTIPWRCISPSCQDL